MNAALLLFPPPGMLRTGTGTVRRPATLHLEGAPVPAWLRRRLARSCHGAPAGQAPVRALLDPGLFPAVPDSRRRAQSYTLTLGPAGEATVAAPAEAGLRYGLLTLAHLFDAAARGHHLAPLTIRDIPAFAVRGFQIDLAREYFPSVPFLKGMLDRAVDLKCNTVWLYLENRFHAPGLEDLSPPGGLTPAQARDLSAYAAERGLDLVPGTNLLSHMEGWFRLERYSDLTDGSSRSYPILTRPESWKLVRTYLDALAEAFPSPNFHAGLDELLFTGTHPEAAAAIAKRGKPAYFADFALKVIRRLQRVHGKTVWMWDDMVMGKNVFRSEGFNDAYREALDRIPRDVVMTHWYYWTDSDGKHGPILKRVAGAGRPFVVAPSAGAYGHDSGCLARALDNQRYMAGCGRKHGAFGLVNTHWESRYGSSFLASWPLLASAAAFAWSGPVPTGAPFRKALSFALCGDTGALTGLLETLDAVQDGLAAAGVGRAAVRGLLFLDGPPTLWRATQAKLTPAIRRRLRAQLARARAQLARVGNRNPLLREALELGPLLFETGLDVIDAFDRAWKHWHKASLLERAPGSKTAFGGAVRLAVAEIGRAAKAIRRIRRLILALERKTGHTPYDAVSLSAWLRALEVTQRLMARAAREAGGLPCFEKLLALPPGYYGSNLDQLRIQNTFHPWFRPHDRNTPPPVRWD